MRRSVSSASRTRWRRWRWKLNGSPRRSATARSSSTRRRARCKPCGCRATADRANDHRLALSLSHGLTIVPTVLIVDDEPNIRRMVGALLRGEEYEVRDAPDGASGVARAMEQEPDVVLLDLMMPGELDGLAVLGKLR